jgi:hypothetical protein
MRSEVHFVNSIQIAAITSVYRLQEAHKAVRVVFGQRKLQGEACGERFVLAMLCFHTTV